MKFQCEKNLLVAAVNTVSRAVSARTSLPILSHILVRADGGRLRLAATDLETSIQCEVVADVQLEGGCTMPARLLGEVVGELPDGVVSVTDVGSLTEFKSRETRFQLNSMSAEEYPNLPTPPEVLTTSMPQNLLRRALKSVAIASATQEETRAVLQGVHMALQGTQAIFVATDGRRLAKIELTLPDAVEPPQVAILPARAVGELQRLLKDTGEAVRFSIHAGQIFFALEDTLISARLLDGKFPNYRNLLPTQFASTVILDRERFISAVRRSLIMAQEKVTPRLVRLNFTGETMTIAANAPDLGAASDAMPVTRTGPEIEIAFNGKFLLDGLNTLGETEIRLLMNEAASAAILQPVAEGVNYLYLLMPVRIQKDEPVPVGANTR